MSVTQESSNPGNPNQEFSSGPPDRIVLDGGDAEQWRTTTCPELLFVESGEIVLKVAYGDAGTTLDSTLVAHSSTLLPPGLHHCCSARVPAVALRTKQVS